MIEWWPDTAVSFIDALVQGQRKHGHEVRVFQGLASTDARPIWAVGRKEVTPDSVGYPYFRSHDGSGVRRFATYSSFALRSSASFRDLGWADVVLAYGSPATAVSAPMLARRWLGVPYVMMVQDVWPDSIFATGFVESAMARRIAERAVGGFVTAAYRSAAAITAQTPGMRELLIARGAAPERTHVVYNWARHERVVAPRVRPPREPLHLMYAGNLGPGQDLGNVLRALALLPEGVARLSLVGDGADVPQLQRLTAELGLGGSVNFMGPIPLEDIPAMVATADLHLVSLADEEVFRITVPSKLQSLMAMGLPVLSAAPGEVGRLVGASGCGLSAPPGDPHALAAAMLEAASLDPAELAARGPRGAAYYYAHMSREASSDALARILDEVAAAGRGMPRWRARRPRPA